MLSRAKNGQTWNSGWQVSQCDGRRLPSTYGQSQTSLVVDVQGHTDIPNIYFVDVFLGLDRKCAACKTSQGQHSTLSTCRFLARDPSVCLSHGWISQKRLKLGLINFNRTVALFTSLRVKFYPEILTGSQDRGRQTRKRWGKTSHFLALNINISKTVKDTPKLGLLLMTNRKSHMHFRLTTRSMTLDDLLVCSRILLEFSGSSQDWEATKKRMKRIVSDWVIVH